MDSLIGKAIAGGAVLLALGGLGALAWQSLTTDASVAALTATAQQNIVAASAGH